MKLIKKLDPVLAVAWVLAIVSAFFVKPSKEYIGYIDFRSLGILWGLMVIIQGFRQNTVFEKIAGKLMGGVKKAWQLAAVLIFMCFIGSMFITNDVALITFVPFALMVLHSCGRDDMMIPVIVFQTIAANLGSMLTPIGNPQNLYIYGLTGMSLPEFVSVMLPYTLVSAVMLGLAVFTIPNKKAKLETTSDANLISEFGSVPQIVIYCLLFIVALLSVVRVIPWYFMVAAVFVVVAIMDYQILFRADYILLLTFIGFFIFTGNLAKIDVISNFLGNIMEGKEFALSVITSQFISNVPATLMLSGFTTEYKELLAGVNVGGLGTLIASMASLISFKAYTKEHKESSGKYFAAFTIFNIVFLIVLCVLHLLVHL